jgi:uncharacterized protein (DUF697 family)
MAKLPSKVPGPKGFVDVIKSVSIAEIAREAKRPLSIAVIGTAERRTEAIQALSGVDVPGQLVDATPARALPETPFVQGFDAMTLEANFPRQSGIYDFVIDVGGGREESPDGTLIYSVADLGGWESTLERILDDRPDLSLALARNFPVFRRRVAQRVITQTATVNAQFSLVTGIVEQIPIMGIIGLPGTAVSDIIVLTKNQVMMTLRLAAAYGLEVDGMTRLKELAPIVVNGFGWRAVARELVGAVPVIGFLPRAMISYAGTVTVGKTAQLYYETGEQVTAAHMRRLYRDAYAAARDRVRTLADAVRNGKGGDGGGGGGNRRIPAANVKAIDVSAETIVLEDRAVEDGVLEDRA